MSKTEDTGLLLWQASNKWQRELNKALKKHDITHVQYFLLAAAEHLGQLKKEITQMSLALYSGIDKMMASKVLRTLEKKRLISRRSSENDSRSIRIQITSFGKLTLSKAVAEVGKSDRTFFKNVSKKQKSFNKKLKSLIS